MHNRASLVVTAYLLKSNTLLKDLWQAKYRNNWCKIIANTIRSSRPEVFCKKGVLRNFAKFTGKHLCLSLFFNKVLAWCFPVNFARFLRTPLVAASLLNCKHWRKVSFTDQEMLFFLIWRLRDWIQYMMLNIISKNLQLCYGWTWN